MPALMSHPSTRRRLPDNLPRVPSVVGYIRVSSEAQVTEGHSLETQERMIREWCEDKLGAGQYRLEVFRDEGLSGSLGWSPNPHGKGKHRPGLAAAAALLEADTVDYFVVYHSDRTFRNHQESVIFRARFFGEGARCRFVSLLENLDLSTETGKLVANITSAFAEHHRGRIRQNVRFGMKSRRQEGYPTGDIGYGWQRTPREGSRRPGLIAHPDQIDWVREIYRLYSLGWGTRIIAKEMERRGAPAPSKSGLWKSSNVQSILRNPLHAGQIRDGVELARGVHWEQRIVEPEEYLRVLELMGARRHEPQQTEKELQPLYQLGRCGTCGGLLTSVVDDTGPAYRCRGSADRGDVLPPAPAAGSGGRDLVASGTPTDGKPWRTEWCPGWHKAAERVNAELLRLLTGIVCQPEFRQLAEEETRLLLLREGREALTAQREQLLAAIRDQEARRERLTRGYIAGLIAEADFQKMAGELRESLDRSQAELEVLERRLRDQLGEQNLLARIQEQLPRLDAIWEVLLPEERRQLVRDLTDYVVLERSRAGEVTLRVKLPYLPEMRSQLRHGKARDAGFAAGVTGLTPRELAYLCLIAEGESPRSIRERWQSNSGQIYNLKRSILRRLQVGSIEAAVALAMGRIQGERNHLPLDVPTTAARASWRPTVEERLQQILRGGVAGKDDVTLSAELGLTRHTIRVLQWEARKRYGVATLAEAVARFAAGDPVPPRIPRVAAAPRE